MHLSNLMLEVIAGISIIVLGWSTFSRNWSMVVVAIVTMILCGLTLAFRLLGTL